MLVECFLCFESLTSPSPSAFKDSCNYNQFTQMIQDNLLILKSLITNLNSICKVPLKQYLDYCLNYQGMRTVGEILRILPTPNRMNSSFTSYYYYYFAKLQNI